MAMRLSVGQISVDWRQWLKRGGLGVPRGCVCYSCRMIKESSHTDAAAAISPRDLKDPSHEGVAQRAGLSPAAELLKSRPQGRPLKSRLGRDIFCVVIGCKETGVAADMGGRAGQVFDRVTSTSSLAPSHRLLSL